MSCGATVEQLQNHEKYYDIRISMKDYIKKLYEEAHTNGSPLIRTMFMNSRMIKVLGAGGSIYVRDKYRWHRFLSLISLSVKCTYLQVNGS